MNVVQILQGNPELQINGLILMDSVGLYEQTPGQLTKGFASDSLLSTPGAILHSAYNDPHLIKKGIQVSTEVVLSMLRNFTGSPRTYAGNLKEEIAGMAKANPRLSEIKVPVVLVSGTSDPISDPEKIMPTEHEEKIRHEQADEPFQDPREIFLKDQIFPHSPYVRMVKPSKMGNHGIPFFRPESMARASLYLLERYARQGRDHA